MMDAEETRKKLEQDIIAIIEQKLKNGEMDATRAQEIAKMVLEKLHPPLTLEQIYEIAPTLDDHFQELASAVQPILNEHQEVIKEVVSKHAAELIKSGRFEEAHHALKQATTSVQ